MYNLVSTIVKTKVSKILHIMHPADTKNPVVVDEAAAVKSSISSICKAGEHTLTDQRWNEFDVIALHSCSDKLQMDYLQKLQSLQERLLDAAEDSRKRLLIYGNAIQLVGSTVFIVPHRGNVAINDQTSVGKINTNTEGLDITGIIADYDFSTARVSDQYIKSVQYLSRKQKIWLLSPETVLVSDGTVSSGKLYVADHGKISQVQRCDDLNDTDADDSRKIKPITPVYKD